jgi:outer membrane protein assembly factor BamB
MSARYRSIVPVAALVAALAACSAPPASEDSVTQASQESRCEWTQWGHDASHAGVGCAEGQALATQRAHVVLDPFVDQEVADAGFGDAGPLLIHYQVPLISGDDVFVMRKAGTYTSCDPPGSGTPFPCGAGALDSQIWTERAYRWHHGRLDEQWTFTSDWKPAAIGIEAMFQPALAGRYLYVPGAGGSVFKVDAHSGHLVKRIKPFGATLDPHTYVWGGIASDGHGNVYYNVVSLDPATADDVFGAWLIKIDDRDRVAKVDYTTLIPDAPAATDLCYKTFFSSVPRPRGPFPPAPQPDGSPTLPDRGPCGSQAPGLNLTPAIGRDGTIFTATRAQQAVNGASFVVALRPNLTLAWAASLAGRLHDGCGVLATRCRAGATFGVDPQTNLPPEGQVSDASSGSPIALPDGGVAYGALTIYNGARGHLMKFDRHGQFTGAFDFGWDVTPAIYAHNGTYSIITKDNDYFNRDFRITQLDANLAPEWSHHATNTQTCERQPDGTITCVDDGESPTGFEWCMNAPVVDREGTVYGTSEDGNIYAIGQGGVELGRFFLDRTRAASYTPAAIDQHGRIYALNNGELFVVGDARPPHR